ncbi:MAG: UvrD-helicase domain-containing protein [Burkholderiales bacterium]|nr:UvrD-helicase domain-containing protein [Burkholderiales bacterium]
MTNPLAAFEHNGSVVTRSQFYAIACDPRRSVAVEACAGAGKTWMLVSRMVRALLLGCEPQNILAITFTKKAAGEMRQRLQEWLQKFALADDATLRQELRDRGMLEESDASQLQTLRGLHGVLLRKGRAVQIRTFHSWFAALLRTAPLSALHDLGLPTRYELLEDDAQAVALTWRRFQTQVATEPQARSDYLEAVATYGRHQAHVALEAALAKRVEFALADQQGLVDASVDHFSLQFADFADLQDPAQYLWTQAMQKLLTEAARLLGAATQATLISAAQKLERGITEHDSALIWDALLTKKAEPRKLSDKLPGIERVRQAQDALLRMGAAQDQHQAWLHQQRMARLTRLLSAQYAALKRERGWIDMGDLERAALALMSDPVLSGWVQERLDARVQHLLIDEFQDTNPLQWQALSAWLSGYAGAAQAPSVFLVGDPKQSIYRFRRAEPQVFRAAQRFVVEALGGDRLACDHTRRNALGVVGLVNQVMEQAQAEGEFDGFRPHSTESDAPGQVLKLPRIARAEAAAGAVDAPWRDSLTVARVVVEETGKTLECRQAARWVAAQLRSGSVAPKDVMVLARRRERLGLMQAELAALHIAALQPEKTELGECPEVQDLVALLDALVSPAHSLALARALKSPLFGLTDADLVQLVLHQRALQGTDAPHGTPISWWQVLQQAPELSAALAAPGPVLRRWKAWVDALPPHDALSAIYADGDVLARYAAAASASQRFCVLANLRALLATALQLGAGRYASAYALVRALRAGGIQAPRHAHDNAVRLLTIHGAKGLEAKVVLMLDTDGEALRTQSMGVLVDWPGEAPHPQRFVFLASESRPPVCAQQTLAVDQAARRREEFNALYVALTRAKETLVFSSLQPFRQSDTGWWDRLQQHATEVSAGDAPDSTGAAADAPPSDTIFALLELPQTPQGFVEESPGAIQSVADSLESRIGQAMHRLLEWVDRVVGAATPALWSARQQQALAQQFLLDANQVAQARNMALAILGGEAAWAWDAHELAWSGNEVALNQGGRVLRIDRLVQRRSSAHWWVLDFKSATEPEQQAALREQLSSYRAALALLQPGQRVRAAFLTARGRMVELGDT